MFIGVRQAWSALDVSAGGGYTTELLARAVGPDGARVWPDARARPRQRSRRAEDAGGATSSRSCRPFEDPAPPSSAGRCDLVTLMFNYHDFGHMGVDRAA